MKRAPPHRISFNLVPKLNKKKSMKKQKKTVLFSLLLIILGNHHLFSQEFKSSIMVSSAISHLTRNGFEDVSQGFYRFPIDPGLEVAYLLHFENFSDVGIGLSYQYWHFANRRSTVRRFRLSEISVPVFFQKAINHGSKCSFTIISGINPGQFIHLDWEGPNKDNGWSEIRREFDETYSEKSFFIDTSFGAGFNYSQKKRYSIFIIPFVKYRLKDNWMEYYREKFYYGIRVGYQFNFKKNEK